AKTAPEAMIYCMAGSETEKAAADVNYPAVREFYADRDYDNSGSIVFTRQVGKLDPQKLADKCLRACKDGTVETVTGDIINIEFDSICFHSDAPSALDNGQMIRKTLIANGITITTPSISITK
ncbi:MAG: LamB/YcsF family protein, partial [Rhizobiales bacterium]|nr:LamB/YcsF family protein [Hyphomicrobiales bacterium]